MRIPASATSMFTQTLARWVDDALVGAALVDRDGHTVACAGAISEEEAMPLAALVMYRLKAADLAARLFAGEVVSLDLDGREVAVGVAKRQLFVVAELGSSTPGTRAMARDLRDEVERMLAQSVGDLFARPGRGGGESGSGPAELPLVELGVLVHRERGKA